ncbi:tetratricopeptide repeat protein [Kitasatospora acidiphila]|uniref:Tetratricopeptide repeat protein n=1 Tax=Kitasatospora acidiphila TaxID=2567942 RepID=A0A540WAX8_9ACTN|nr:tetratricopeptide repeat protein [Kitasatospora acidiphila]TQF06067.1 tetratricopeptide repeat protein [Kitasatospora acidiphila]
MPRPQQRGGPDPGKAADLAEFIGLLGELRIWAGQPSYRELAKRVGPLLRPARTVSPFTVVDAFKVARRRLDLDLVVGIVRALGLGEDEVDRWRQACVRVHARAKTGGPTGVLRQLPADLATFTGRGKELDALLAVVGRVGTAGAAAVVISAIEGMAGVGKTQLAIHAAHRLVRDGHYQDMQLYVNLRGFDPELPPIDPAAVLDTFLRHLKVPAQQIPDGLDERAAMFRDRIDGKHALIILDNAADAQQVRPLVPSSPSCLVMITTRRSLIELDDAVVTQLDLFEPRDAVSLLARIVGAERVAAEPEAAEAVVEACGYLPLAVALAAGRLRSRPSWSLAYLLSRLRKHGVDAVSTPERSLQDVFNLSYEELDPRTQRLFRLLALHPGPDFTPPAVAALAELSETEAELLLEHLQDEHLVQQQSPGRYALHDLLHAYAAARARQHPDEERAATERVLSWYLASVDAATRRITPARYVLPPELAPRATAPAEFDGSAEAMAWCDQEYANLLAAAERAAGISSGDLAWQLATSTSKYLFLRCHWQESLRVHELGLEAAAATHHLAVEAWVRGTLGMSLAALGEPGLAAPQLTRALELRREPGEVSAEAAGFRSPARVLVESQELEASLDGSLQALETAVRTGDRQREGAALNGVAICLWELKRPLEAIDYLRRKSALHRADGDPIGLGLALHNIAEFHETVQRYDEALEALQEAQEIARACGDPHAEAGALFGIARCLSATGQHQAARPDLERALAVFERLRAQEAGDARELLTPITKLADDDE